MFQKLFMQSMEGGSLPETRRRRGSSSAGLVNADEKFPSQLMATPERMYDRACAITLLNRVLAQLCQEMQAEGKKRPV